MRVVLVHYNLGICRRYCFNCSIMAWSAEIYRYCHAAEYENRMILNVDKSVCMTSPQEIVLKLCYLALFPPLRVGREMLHFVSCFK